VNELTESKENIKKEIRKLEKKESYNKKALEISKEVIRNLSICVESYKFYSYTQILERLGEKMNIDMDYGLFLDAIEALEREGFLSTDKVIFFPD